MKGGRAPRTTGKHFELEVARRIGGSRAGYGNASTMPDVSNSVFEIEAKVMDLPAKLEDALVTVKSRGNKAKLQMVVFKPKGAGWDQARVYLSFNDFMEWYG
jgi:hypothetical protein